VGGVAESCCGGRDEETGQPLLVDTHGTLSLQYANGNSAACSFSMVCNSPEETIIHGERGFVRIHGPAHCPERATIATPCGRGFAERVVEEKLPVLEIEGEHDFLFPGSQGFVHEALGVYAALRRGDLECAEYTWEDTRCVAELMDRMRGELGVTYAADAA
jgi:hypothetical protein